MTEFIKLYFTDMETFLFGSLIIPLIIGFIISLIMLIKSGIDILK